MVSLRSNSFEHSSLHFFPIKDLKESIRTQKQSFSFQYKVTLVLIRQKLEETQISREKKSFRDNFDHMNLNVKIYISGRFIMNHVFVN